MVGDQQENAVSGNDLPLDSSGRDLDPLTIPTIQENAIAISASSVSEGWVTKAGLGYDVLFSVLMVCDNQPGGAEFRFDDFQLVPAS